MIGIPFRSIVLLFVFLGLSGHFAQAQIGVSGHWVRQNFVDWNDQIQPDVLPNDNVFGSGFQIGVDYRIVPFEARVEFLPSVVYTLQSGSFETTIENVHEFDLSSIGLHLDINIYPLDIEGDCNCPTWGKSGGVFDKGLFFSLSPGVDWFTSDHLITNPLAETVEVSESVLRYSIGAGLGLDIGLSQYVTLTPYVGGRYVLPFEFEGFIADRGYEVPDRETAATQIEAGIRVGFHFTN